jgi:hypothetical protein
MDEDTVERIMSNPVWINDLKRLSLRFKRIFSAEPDFSDIVYPNGIPATEQEQKQREEKLMEVYRVKTVDEARRRERSEAEQGALIAKHRVETIEEALEAEQRCREETAEQARMEADELGRMESEVLARRLEAEERARREAEEQERMESEALAKMLEAEERARREAIEQRARREAVQQRARREAVEQRARREASEQQGMLWVKTRGNFYGASWSQKQCMINDGKLRIQVDATSDGWITYKVGRCACVHGSRPNRFDIFAPYIGDGKLLLKLAADSESDKQKWVPALQSICAQAGRRKQAQIQVCNISVVNEGPHGLKIQNVSRDCNEVYSASFAGFEGTNSEVEAQAAGRLTRYMVVKEINGESMQRVPFGNVFLKLLKERPCKVMFETVTPQELDRKPVRRHEQASPQRYENPEARRAKSAPAFSGMPADLAQQTRKQGLSAKERAAERAKQRRARIAKVRSQTEVL